MDTAQGLPADSLAANSDINVAQDSKRKIYRHRAEPIDVCASIALYVEREEQQFRDRAAAAEGVVTVPVLAAWCVFAGRSACHS